MRICSKQALPGFALVIAVPLIPGLACLAARQPAAPGYPAARCRPSPSSSAFPYSFPRPADGISPAECSTPVLAFPGISRAWTAGIGRRAELAPVLASPAATGTPPAPAPGILRDAVAGGGAR